MKLIYNTIRRTMLAIALLCACGATAQAQSTVVEESCDPHRTRLIPYPTAASAAERGLEQQRYMQPLTAWTTTAEGSLHSEFTYPFSWVERQIFARVEPMGQPYELYINGRRAGASTNGFAAAEFNITKLSKEDKNSVELVPLVGDNVTAIECFDKTSSPTPTIYIISQPRVRVRDVAWRATKGMGSVVNADFSVVMHNETLGEKSSRLYYELYLNDTTRLVGGHLDVKLGMRGCDTMRFGAPIPDSVLWSNSNPMALSLRLHNRIAGRDVEFYNIDVAMRELLFDNGTFHLNGIPVEVEWHDMSPLSTIEDIAKAVNMGHSAIRFTAGCVSDEVLEYCDDRGIYVALTAPINSSKAGKSRKRGGNPSNNPAWRNDYVVRSCQMIHSTKRHPSVIAYFLADDSANGICLYESYLAMKAIAQERPIFYRDGGNEWNNDR